MSPRIAGAIGVGCALAVAAVWAVRRPSPAGTSALESTRSVRVARHDAFGAPGEAVMVTDRARARAIVGALGVDATTPAACPADYATSELGFVLAGSDVYARRNVYVWGLAGRGADATVIVVTSAGCTRGAVAAPVVLRDELARLGLGVAE